jgi:hypothetical protein
MKKCNISKRVLAVILALAMMIPGVYFGTPNQNEVKAAASSSSDMLEIKAQVAVDQADAIRFIASVDSLDYSKVGFEVITPSKTITWETRTVYERIVSCVTNDEYEFSPKLVDTTSEYFVTAMLKAEAGVDYKVRAFVCEKGSGEKLYGASRTISLSDANDNVINMCEIKFYSDDFTVTRDYYKKILNRQTILAGHVSPKIVIHSTLITTFGLTQNEYSSAFSGVILLDDLFKDE